MAFSKEFVFPSEEELTVQELNISSSFLKAGAIHYGKYCEKENNEFMLCRKETEDPRQCLKEGRDVTNCGLKFFCNLKKHCRQEFEQFASCLNKSFNMDARYCRKTEAVFDKCVLDKLGQDRPPFGWQAEVHIHKTNRPKPKDDIIYFPNIPDKLPDDYKREEPRYGYGYKY